ncbi:ABC transporter ATP-binding protein [Allochromatium tepidum]|uniref:Methionine ABC transporter ATP-binding protein n=1 Tax=Allochromatium tepidum TaxID=553982 RepID=A0ABN6GA25_9GAMM|nr:ABC transporter ATP-binding protein [Allochromatium tepidum]BCU06508.1 methionine ABC transporter ATP-binding protein [Allochromatium tepidum]
MAWSRTLNSDSDTQRQPAVEIRDLTFRWTEPGPPVLRLDHLRIERGERVFVAGPSGSGKTTLLNLLAGVAVPRQGSLRVLGRPLEATGGARRDHFRADHIGYIFQMFNLILYLSVLENVQLPCHFSRIRRERARRRSGTPTAEARRLLKQLDMADAGCPDSPVNALSVGQQQRVAAARAFMGAPELLIADEPTSSLDADRRTAFIQLLFQECADSGATLVFVSHDNTLAPLFDRTLSLAALNRATADRETALQSGS